MFKFVKEVFSAIVKALSNPCWDCPYDGPRCYDFEPNCPKRKREEEEQSEKD